MAFPISTYRYPGVKPFETSEQDLFFGRDRDIQDLFDLIRVEKLVVLFGKSGYGKSSLLNAGIFPLLTSYHSSVKEQIRYEPLVVRFGTYSETNEDYFRNSLGSKNHSPLGMLVSKMNEQFGKESAPESNPELLLQLTGKKSLWYELKRRQDMNIPKRFVLIFDQFEEFFSYPVKEQQDFKDQLTEMLYQSLPNPVREAAPTLDRSLRLFLSEPIDLRIVVAIRSDRMSLLDTLKDQFPSILYRTYQLKGLTTEQAREAIVQPAGIKHERFQSPRFIFTEEAITKILDELQTQNTHVYSSEGAKARVEAFQLQILCEHLESEIRNGKIASHDDNSLPTVGLDDLPSMLNLYENYYNRKLSELAPGLQDYAQLVLEEGLLTEDAITGEGLRMSVDSRALTSQFNLNDLEEDLLEALSNTFLIRAENNSVGGINYEISHDTLVPPIVMAKKTRKNREAQATFHIEQQAAEIRLKEEARKRRVAEQITQRTRLLAAAAFTALVFALFALFWALNAQKNAEGALAKYKYEEGERIKAQGEVRKRNFEEAVNRAYGQLGGGKSCVSTETAELIEKLSAGIDEKRYVNQLIMALNIKISQNKAGCALIKSPK